MTGHATSKSVEASRRIEVEDAESLEAGRLLSDSQRSSSCPSYLYSGTMLGRTPRPYRATSSFPRSTVSPSLLSIVSCQCTPD